MIAAILLNDKAAEYHRISCFHRKYNMLLALCDWVKSIEYYSKIGNIVKTG